MSEADQTPTTDDGAADDALLKRSQQAIDEAREAARDALADPPPAGGMSTSTAAGRPTADPDEDVDDASTNDGLPAEDTQGVPDESKPAGVETDDETVSVEPDDQ